MTDQQGNDGSLEERHSFEKRLASARTRQGLDPKDEPAVPGANSAWGIGMRVGVELVAALAVGLAIGWALDHWLHTLPLFLVIFVLLGGVAGIVNVWRMMGPRKL